MGKKLPRGLRAAYAKPTSCFREGMFKNPAPSAWLTRALRVLSPTDDPERCDKDNRMTLWRRLRLPYADGD